MTEEKAKRAISRKTESLVVEEPIKIQLDVSRKEYTAIERLQEKNVRVKIDLAVNKADQRLVLVVRPSEIKGQPIGSDKDRYVV